MCDDRKLFPKKLFQFFSVHYVITIRLFASLFVQMIERIYEDQKFADLFHNTCKKYYHKITIIIAGVDLEFSEG